MTEITLDPPLKYLVKSCETVCVAECCGIDAYDVSPFHVASYLIRYDGKLNMGQIEEVREQLAALERLASDLATGGDKVVIPEMNQMFRSEELKCFVRDMYRVIARAIEVVEAERALGD